MHKPLLNDNYEIILLVPFLTDKTTSVERFKSIIKELERFYSCITIIHVEYPADNPFMLGHQSKSTDEPSQFISTIRTHKPKLNFLKKLAFYYLKGRKKSPYRFVNLVHLVLFGHDSYHPGKITVLPKKKQGAVITFGSPFSYFSAAADIASQTNYHLVLDYRDPWTYGYFPVDGSETVYKLRVARQRHIENLLLQKSDLVTTVSKTLKSYFPLSAQAKINVIPNGNNVSLLGGSTPNPNPPRFNLVYLGTLYNDQLLDNTFFEAFKFFIQDKDRSIVNLIFLGSANNTNLTLKLQEYNLGQVSEITDRLTFEQTVPYLENACVFLHFKYGKRSGIITSKQADYLAYRKPILLPQSDNGDLEESILTCKAGYVCHNVEENSIALNEIWTKWVSKQSLIIEQAQEDLVKRNRESIATEFVELIQNLSLKKPLF